MSIPDPNEDIDESKISAAVEKRSEIAQTMAKNGFIDTLVLSRDRVNSLSQDHLNMVEYLDENGRQKIDRIAEKWMMNPSNIKDIVGDLNKLGITDINGDYVELQHNHVLISLV